MSLFTNDKYVLKEAGSLIATLFGAFVIAFSDFSWANTMLFEVLGISLVAMGVSFMTSVLVAREL
jgi:hypothetical protein